ncbi:MAG: carbohydrate ABC transporter permease, partial [Rhodospirillaceae bacterium]|nr:carbohydrate ABC transporter permease [Rhodospirillaceae bacterium]
VPSLDKYLHAFAQGDYLTFFTNTVVVVGVSIAVALAFALPAAYKLAFFPGRRAGDILFFALSTRFLPGVAVIVPIFLVYSRLGLIDTLHGLVLIHVALSIPLALWLMRRFFAEIPPGVIEAAMLDGASHAQVFWRVVMPLSLPGLATTAFLLVIMAWNEFFFAVNLTGRSAATLPVYMASFFTTEGQTWAQMSAAATLAVLPILVSGWFAARGLVRGLIAGSVK